MPIPLGLSGSAGHTGNVRLMEEIMTCIVIFEMTAKEGTGMQLVEALRALLPDTRNKDGCQGVEVTTNLDNTDNLVLVERWMARKDYENYLAWRQQRGDIDKLAGLLAGPPSIRYFNLTSA
jgi:quinol monooxygenase YgiN